MAPPKLETTSFRFRPSEMVLKKLTFIALFILIASSLQGDVLPGFGIEKITDAGGTVTSLAVSPKNGSLWYTVADGRVYRVEDGRRIRVATVETAMEGNMAMLGMNFLPDGRAVLHTVLPDKTADVLSLLDPDTGAVTVFATLPCGNGACETEHHGGNPAVAPDGSVFIALGDLGIPTIAQRDDTPGGKIFRVALDGTMSRYATGFRNPYDMAWDEATQRLIVADNGPVRQDEINFVREGLNYGWPKTMGDWAPVPEMVPPVYVFPDTVAPTGLALLNGSLPVLRHGLLVCGWVSRAVHYFPNLDPPLDSPIELLVDAEQIMDVAQGADGSVYFATRTAIYRLRVPLLGDVNGDGVVDADDYDALLIEISDGDGDRTWDAQGGGYPGTWGADVNEDGVIDENDLTAWKRLTTEPRRRAVRRPF